MLSCNPPIQSQLLHRHAMRGGVGCGPSPLVLRYRALPRNLADRAAAGDVDSNARTTAPHSRQDAGGLPQACFLAKTLCSTVHQTTIRGALPHLASAADRTGRGERQAKALPAATCNCCCHEAQC